MFRVPNRVSVFCESPLSWLALEDASTDGGSCPEVRIGAIDLVRVAENESAAAFAAIRDASDAIAAAAILYVDSWCALGARIDAVHVALSSVQGRATRLVLVGLPRTPRPPRLDPNGQLHALIAALLAERKAAQIETLQEFVKTEASQLIRHAVVVAAETAAIGGLSAAQTSAADGEVERHEALFGDVRGAVESLSLFALADATVARAAAACVATSLDPWGSVDPAPCASFAASLPASPRPADAAAARERTARRCACTQECVYEATLALVLNPVRHFLAALVDEQEAAHDVALRRFAAMGDAHHAQAAFGVPDALIARSERVAAPGVAWRGAIASMRRVFAARASHREQVSGLLACQRIIMQAIVDARGEGRAAGADAGGARGAGADDLLPIFAYVAAAALREMGGPRLRAAGRAALLRATLSSKQRWNVALYACTNLQAVLSYCAQQAAVEEVATEADALSVELAARRLSAIGRCGSDEYMRVLRVMELSRSGSFFEAERAQAARRAPI
jgi:hypothetical protein